MDWHLNETDKKVVEAGQTGRTGYIWNRELFPEPSGFMKELHKRKLRTSLNDSYEDKYHEMAIRLGFDASENKPIPFDCVDPGYLQAYLDIIIKALEEDGQSARSKKYPLIFSRFGGPGSHRYPVGFSGDTVISWASLAFQPDFTATASGIGYGWWSHDIGGHMLGARDDELTVRWTQFGALSPILRLHSTKNRWITKEPWRIQDAPGRILQDLLRFRHRLIPYLQSMNVRASEGEPLVQLLYWQYPKKDEAYSYKNQYYFDRKC
ncbi:glycosyl hydrolases family 31-domain-containing protein [Leptodontidium sp. MPI-SDFR-AT-0119]|nr:glycosyl hydrolases family 31-domain-containing protein [Leptodontidium sp. MPI-SDFR-AT-0119]